MSRPVGAEGPATTPRPSDLILFAACVALAVVCMFGLAAYLNQWTNEHNASLAQACDVCEDTYGGVMPAVVGLFQNVLAVFALCAIALLFGYPHWYWRVPLLVTSLVVMIGGIVYWPCLAVGAVGFAAALKPAARPVAAHLS